MPSDKETEHICTSVRLADLGSLVRGVSFGAADVREHSAKGYTPVLRATNIQDGYLNLSTELVHVKDERIALAQQLRSGDIVIAMSSGSKAIVGKAAQLHERWKGSFGAFCAAYRVESDFADPSFIGYVFHTDGYREHISRSARGTNINNLTRGHVLDFNFQLPPIEEQRVIARALKAIQKARVVRQHESALESERKAALMEHLFTQGAHGESTKETEIGKIPCSWHVGALGEVAKIERGKFGHRPRNAPEFYDGSIPFIQTGDVTASNGRIRNFSQTLNEKGLSVSKVFPKGTIVITIAANIGFTGILEFDSAFPDSLIGITPTAALDTDYLNYYLTTQQSEMDRKAPRGTQKNINIEFLTPWPVVLAPLAEQREIAAIIRSSGEKIEALEREIFLLDELFRATLEEFMTARLSAVGLIEEPQAQ